MCGSTVFKFICRQYYVGLSFRIKGIPYLLVGPKISASINLLGIESPNHKTAGLNASERCVLQALHYNNRRYCHQVRLLFQRDQFHTPIVASPGSA